MKINQFTVKAKVNNLEDLEKKIQALDARLKNSDHLIDTYYSTTRGTLKLREGRRQALLINYENETNKIRRTDEVLVYNHKFSNALKNILAYQFGVTTVLAVKRKTYTYKHFLIQFDRVDILGDFIKIEPQSSEKMNAEKTVTDQFDFLSELLAVDRMDKIQKSYVELVEDYFEPREIWSSM